MATVTGTLTVNAAFLMEIKEDNRELHELLQRAAAAFSRPDRVHAPPRQLADLVSSLRDRLGMHFSLEEAFGYFEDAVSVAPRLNRLANELREEHSGLFVEVCDLVEQAERLQYGETPANAVRSLAENFNDFYRRFQDHDARENEMILQALDDDIGVGD
jgi:iron-sulfur cluster repair protein YtfE (RIC family)